MSNEVAVKKDPPTFKEILQKASKSAVRGGTAGAAAMGANVACLMWMRTTVSTSCVCVYTEGRPFLWLFLSVVFGPQDHQPLFSHCVFFHVSFLQD
mmetsp:Transcript_23625/g.54996  ORF Transcript_23625/g.54996 Transcript_23625/m.54996 type:complete len:96 (-) Transcript_23625:586-873(-)